MEKTKTKEKRIAESLRAKNPFSLKVFKAVAFFYFIYDQIPPYTNHFENIKKLYTSCVNDSVTKLSIILNTPDRTLTRHRNQYIKTFELCEFALKYFDKIFSFIK